VLLLVSVCHGKSPHRAFISCDGSQDSLDWLYENEAWRKEEEHRSEEGSEVTAQRRETAFPCDV
jgi:hypothetical protein